MTRECRYAVLIENELTNWMLLQNRVGEESLTDWMLYMMEVYVGQTYTAYTKRKEAITGADWEWWLIGEQYSFKIQVQAKKFDSSKNCFRHIAYPGNPDEGRQLKSLINYCARSSSYPLYAIYSPMVLTTIPYKRKASVHFVDGYFVERSYNASAVSKNLNGATLLNHSIPLSAIFCPPHKQCKLESFLEEFFQDTDNKYKTDIKLTNKALDTIPGVNFGIPKHIQEFIDFSKSKKNKEKRRDNNDINAFEFRIPDEPEQAPESFFESTQNEEQSGPVRFIVTDLRREN